MDHFTGILTFTKVVETKTFTAAAERLGISQAQVSKEISRLESMLGARLLNRTTRRLSLTEVGSVFYNYCARIEEEIYAAKAAVASHHVDVKGIIRVSAPVAFGIKHVSPAIGTLMQSHPNLQVDLVLDDRRVNLAEEGFDVAIRITKNPDPNLVARPIAPVRWVTCASPAYLKKNGTPSCPDELIPHNCLVYPQIMPSNPWSFQKDGLVAEIKVSGHLTVNNGEALCSAALDSLGIITLPTFLTGEHLKTGRLKQILPDYSIPSSTAYAVYLPNRYLSPKVRAFINFFIERFNPDPYWDAWRALSA